MTGRIEKARAAFTRVYDEDLWGLKKLQPQWDLTQIFADYIEDTMRKYKIETVAEFGCGFWSYAKLIDWSGVTYDGYDVALGPIRKNSDEYGAPNIRFHQFVEGTQLAPADLLICRDVLQHLPTEDVLHYLAMFKELFPYMLIVNDSLPDDNLNGQIDYGGYRALRLDLPPFNETFEVIGEWDNPLFGVPYHKQICLLKGKKLLQDTQRQDDMRRARTPLVARLFGSLRRTR